MNQKRLVRTYLETLTTSELIKMADNLGIDIPPDLERIFIIQELMETSEDLGFKDSQTSMEPINDMPLIESVPLPKQYNINYIEVLLRDSLWAFVYWEIKAHDKFTHESDPGFEGYFLNVIALPGKEKKPVIDPFTISVDISDTSWGIYIQPEITSFRVDLCVKTGETREVIISSREIRVPRIFDPLNETLKDVPEYPILSLSGIEEFEILRNVDRAIRMHRLCED